jgi:hypothetical protein
LAENREYATHALGAFCRHILSNRPMPELSWRHSDTSNGALRLEVYATPPPKCAVLWVAMSSSLDFRDSRWESSPMRLNDSSVQGEVRRPAQGGIAVFGALKYEIDGILYHPSTQIRQLSVEKSAK